MCFTGVNLKWPIGVSFDGFYNLFSVLINREAGSQEPAFFKYGTIF